MEGLISLVGLILIPIFFIAIHLQVKELTEDIKRQVKKLGGRNVEVERIWLDGDKNTFSFRVKFKDTVGKTHWTKCKVRQGSKNIYWTTSPAELLEVNGVVETAVNQSNLQSTDSSKEELINDLYAENQKLKEEIARLQKSNSLKT
ncbi:MAG: hypothetical protein AAF490_25100 [Chloroflexota bacterium]